MTNPARTLSNFDPRQVPVAGVDQHLPAIPDTRLGPDALRQRFRLPSNWSPDLRDEHDFSQREPVSASVLIPIVQREQPMVLLTQRTDHLSSHSGQIAFPGGKADVGDIDAVATALREAHEEVGISPQSVEVLGNLPTYAMGTGFIVTPVVGLVMPGVPWTPNPQEVAHVFEVPLSFLMNPAHHRRHQVLWEGATREWYSMPYVTRDTEWFIWGATAGMLRNLYRFLQA